MAKRIGGLLLSLILSASMIAPTFAAVEDEVIIIDDAAVEEIVADDSIEDSIQEDIIVDSDALEEATTTDVTVEEESEELTEVADNEAIIGINEPGDDIFSDNVEDTNEDSGVDIPEVNEDGIVSEGTAISGIIDKDFVYDENSTYSYVYDGSDEGIADENGGIACDSYDGSNKGNNDYNTYYHTIQSYLVPCSNGTLMRVQYGAVKNALLVEYYDASYNLINKLTVNRDFLSIFGGFYSDGTYNYVLTGQNNLSENDNEEVYRITKYDQNWNYLGRAGIRGANTWKPFQAGTARIVKSGNYLIIRTCHEMYANAGVHHQANVSIEFDTQKIKITDYYAGVYNISNGYVSHSFNQFVRCDGNKVVAIDHGDAYPRSVSIVKYGTDLSSGKYVGSCTNASMWQIKGGKVGDNYTGVSVGGFEISDNNYIVVGNSVDQDNYSSSKTRNVFVSVIGKNFSSNSTASYGRITTYAEGSSSASTPHLVKVNNDAFVIIWSKDNAVYYRQIDGAGRRVGNMYSMLGSLSDCEPVIYNGKIVWYVWNNEKLSVYSINASNLAENSAKDILTGHDYETHYASAGSNVASQVCKRCGDSKTFTTPTRMATVFWQIADSSNALTNVISDSYHVGNTYSVLFSYSGGEDNKEFELISQDSSAVSVIKDSPTMWRFEANKEGATTVTVRAKYNPSITADYTINVGHIYSDVITDESTCTHEGSRNRTCKVCGYKVTEKMPTTDHFWNGGTVINGVRIYTCMICDTSKTEEEIANSSSGSNTGGSSGSTSGGSSSGSSGNGGGSSYNTTGGGSSGGSGASSPSGASSQSTQYSIGGTWVETNVGKWRFRDSSGFYIYNDWAKINGSWYHFDNSGYMQTGWIKVGGYWYYLNANGAMKTGWLKDNGKWYYLGGNGAMRTGWIKDGAWYYLTSSGAMATGWIKDGGVWYYLTASGAMKTGWLKDNGKWYYLKPSGAMATGWVLVDGQWYYMDGSGAMQTGWIQSKGKWYYLYPSGNMARNTYIGNYYVDSSGAYVR